MSAKILKTTDQRGDTTYKLETEKAYYKLTECGAFNFYLCSRIPRYVTYEQREAYRIKYRRSEDGIETAPGEEITMLQFENEQSLIDYLRAKLKEEQPPREWKPKSSGIP